MKVNSQFLKTCLSFRHPIKSVMKLENVLDNLNSFEKNSFLKVISDIVSSSPKNQLEVDKILTETSRNLKDIDSINISRVFSLVQDEFLEHIRTEFKNSSSQLDIVIDIIIKDGNCIMKQDWFSRLYEKEVLNLKKKVKKLTSDIGNPKSDISDKRRRDYAIYSNCLKVAYINDDLNNSERKITSDENSIIVELARCLDLSQEELKLLNYAIIPIEERHIDEVISTIKNLGIAFYSKKLNIVFIPDEIVRCLRTIRGKEIADKFKKRILKVLREPQINLICKAHNIDWRKNYELKVKEIVNEGISLRSILSTDIHKDNTTQNDRKRFLNDLFEKKLNIPGTLKGATLDDKIDSLIDTFNSIEKDEKVGISIEGFEKLLLDLKEFEKSVENQIASEYELQGTTEISGESLIDYNIKPRDILAILPNPTLKSFCEAKGISTRGDEITNIMESYRGSEDIYLENYVAIGRRDYTTLKENGIVIREAEIGVRFEALTKALFEMLGFNVDEELRKKLSTRKDKIDILLNIGDNSLILVECKSFKESGYNKFSSVRRQLKSYASLINNSEYRVIKSLLVAPEFSDEFVNECNLEYELNLSLISAESLKRISTAFKKKKMKVFPYKLLMRDVVIQEDRIIKALEN